MKRWTWAIATIFALLLAFSPVVSTAQGVDWSQKKFSDLGKKPNGKPYKVYVASVFMESEWFNFHKVALERLAKIYGFDLVFADVVGMDVAKLTQAAYDAISVGADLLYYCPQTSAVAQAIRDAQAAGVDVVTFTLSLPEAPGKLSSGMQAIQGITEMARRAAKDLNNRGSVGFNVIQGNDVFIAQMKAIEGVFGNNIKEAVRVDDDGDMNNVTGRIKSALQAHPEINAWISMSALTPAAVTAARELGYKPGQLKIYGLDVVSSTVQLMKQGWISGVLYQPFASESVSDITLWLLSKADPLQGQFGGYFLPYQINIAPVMVTKDNVDKVVTWIK